MRFEINIGWTPDSRMPSASIMWPSSSKTESGCRDRATLFEKFDPITADFTYIRWLGDRKGIDQQTKTWDKTIVDRTQELSSWVDVCQRVQKRGVTIHAYANNHYAGHAPDTVEP